LAYNLCEGANLLDPRAEPQIAVAVLERSRPLKASALCGRPESTDADGADGRPQRPPDSGAMLDRPDPFVAGARGLATYRRTGGRGRYKHIRRARKSVSRCGPEGCRGAT